jgi:hypothetical protein
MLCYYNKIIINKKMSFKEYISQFKDLNEFTKLQKFVLITGQEFENQNYILKTKNNEYPFFDFKTKESNFSYDFTKGDDIYTLNIQNKKDGNLEISISNDRRSTSEEIKLDNYIKNNSDNFSTLENYIKDRLKNFEKDPLFHEERELRISPRKFNDNINDNINNINLREFNNREGNFISNQNIPSGNFRDIGYSDLHGNLPNFVPGYNDSFGRPRGNLMGPEDFGFRGPGFGGIRYDPITPFGTKFDFTPQYDGPMKKPESFEGNIDLGMPRGNGFGLGFGNNFGGSGGGFNPFI